MAKEAKARIRINDHLQRSGWRFFDDENGPANISLETRIKRSGYRMSGQFDIVPSKRDF
jgi:type I restriction enzyme R subunit